MNVVYVVLDCVRWKSLRLGGGRRVANTPHLDRFAKSGRVYTHAVAPSNWTIPSHMSMLTGEYPQQHRVRTYTDRNPTAASVVPELAARGYETCLFSEQEHLVARIGVENGFQSIFFPGTHEDQPLPSRIPLRRLLAWADIVNSQRFRALAGAFPALALPANVIGNVLRTRFKASVTGTETVGAFLAWLQERKRSNPFFAFVNIVDAHEPFPHPRTNGSSGLLTRLYSSTPPSLLLSVPSLQRKLSWEEVEAGYLECVERADSKLGRLLDGVVMQCSESPTLVIVTSDHGQSFGEGGYIGHGNGVMDSVTRVPLIVASFGGPPLHGTVDQWTSLCELPDMIRRVTGKPTPSGDGDIELLREAPTGPGKIVYCDGSPASEAFPSLRAVGTGPSWNRRQIAAYQQDEKFVLDTTSRQIAWWGKGMDPDRDRPESLGGDALARATETLFEPYLRLPGSGVVGTTALPDIPLPVMERLKLWGYD